MYSNIEETDNASCHFGQYDMGIPTGYDIFIDNQETYSAFPVEDPRVRIFEQQPFPENFGVLPT